MVSEICNSLGGKGGRVSFTNCVLERDIITLAKEEEEEEEEVTRTTTRRRTRKEKKRAPSRSPRPFRTVFPVQTSSSSSSSKESNAFWCFNERKE